MAGYSGTPLGRKLGIEEGHRVLVCNPPVRLPEELREYAEARHHENLDVVVLFADSYSLFRAEFERLMRTIRPDGAIWAAWPKKASGVRTDLTETAIRDHALTTAFVDVKVCAIDETWSGLKLVVRKELRAAFAQGKN